MSPGCKVPGPGGFRKEPMAARAPAVLNLSHWSETVSFVVT
jgi:hypothetical protein